MRSSLLRVVVTLVAAAAVMVPVAGRAESGPALSVPEHLLADALRCPAKFKSPHDPVLLVHGTLVTADENWSWNYAEQLPKLGFDVCMVDLPQRAIGDIQVSSEYVVYAVRAIAHESDRTVDVVGLSQGGLEPRWAIKWWPDVRAAVDDYVGIVTPSHGTVFVDSSCVESCVPAFWQMRPSSHFLAALNAGDETPGDVDYTSVYSRTDQFVQPQVGDAPTSALAGGTNVAIQDVCPGRPVDHVGSTADAAVYEVVIDALRHDGPASHDRISRLGCTTVFMPSTDAQEMAAADLALYGVIMPEYMVLGGGKTTEEPPLAPYAR